jgi:formylglycine-generating enzyme required for sulfatase activity
MISRHVAASLIAASLLACVGTRTPPNIPKQAVVKYGEKIYLADHTQGTDTLSSVRCQRFAVPMGPIPTSSTATVALAPTDGLLGPDGRPEPVDPRQPHNCYVQVVSGQLNVDAVEVTNDLYQLCVDSGVCPAPDPSKASRDSSCSSGDRFEECPVGEVTQEQANLFCKFIGRRLPSGIEHVIMRQSGASDTQDPSKIPVFPNGKDESKPPTACNVVVGTPNAGCKGFPAPITVDSNPDDTIGAAPDDVVPASMGKVYDLMGNVSEWSSDLLPSIRIMGLPWFCQAPVLTDPANGKPLCPTNATCIFGSFEPPGQIYGVYPVCIAYPGIHPTSGSEGSLFGGSFLDMLSDRDHIGTYARRALMSPNDNPARQNGLRCVGDLMVKDTVVPKVQM